MEQRISLVTLGVARARAFYDALGWSDAQQPDDEVCFFQAGGMVFGLWTALGVALTLSPSQRGAPISTPLPSVRGACSQPARWIRVLATESSVRAILGDRASADSV